MKNSIAIETFQPCETNEHNDFLLTGHCEIEKANQEYMFALKMCSFSENNLIKNAIGLGEENLFNYILESFVEKEQVKFETGIGYAYESNNKVYFKRIQAITHGVNLDQAHLCVRQPSYDCFPNSINIIRSYIPELYFQNLHFDNSILIATAPYLPSCLKINPNSLVGRLNNDLVSIPLDSPDLINIIVNNLSQYSKQISLKTSKLSAPKLSTKEIQLQHNDGNNVKKNTLVYDESLDVIKFFDGNKWRKLKWDEDENAE